MRNVDKLPKQCVLCGRQWGPHVRGCCTPTSLVAVLAPGFLIRKPRYYDLRGIELTDRQLEEMREREKEVQLGRLQQPERPAAEPRPAEVAQQPTHPVPQRRGWEREARKLRLAFYTYITFLTAFWAILIAYFAADVGPLIPLFGLASLATFVSFIVATVRAYGLQERLDALGPCKPAAGRFLWGTLLVFVSFLAVFGAEKYGYSRAPVGILSPFALGFYLPYSVLRRARRIERGLVEQAGGQVAGPADDSKW